MNWCFAKINNRLAEIYFEKKKGRPKIIGHCYVREKEYKTKKELVWIKADTAKFKFVHRNRKYKNLDPNGPELS